jgi:hypothetical protein
VTLDLIAAALDTVGLGADAEELARALALRDRLEARIAALPGCDRPGTWSEAHHVVPWEQGGATNPGNLVVLCARHQHVLHRPGWHARLDPDGTLTITDAHGTPRTTRPPATGPPTRLAA